MVCTLVIHTFYNFVHLTIGGDVAEAFTNAFVSIKVSEARGQMEECLECLCASNGLTCASPVLNNVTCSTIGGKQYHLHTKANHFNCNCLAPSLPGETPLKIFIEQNADRLSPSVALVLRCAVNCSASLYWTFNGASLPTRAVVTDVTAFSSTITIVEGGVGDAGLYACLAHTPSESYNAIATVSVEFYGECRYILSLYVRPSRVLLV